MDLVFLAEKFPMFFVLGLIALAVVEFVRERLSVELISVAIFAILIMFGSIFP